MWVWVLGGGGGAGRGGLHGYLDKLGVLQACMQNWHLSQFSAERASRVAFLSGGESDEEIRRVPELGSELAGPSSSGAEVGSAGRPVRAQSSAPASQRKRGRSPADKEHKRLKRSLKNILCTCNLPRNGTEIVHIKKMKM